MRIDRPPTHRFCENHLSEANLSFVERLPSSPGLPHCCAAIKPPTAHGTQLSFHFQESSHSPILHCFFPETPSTLASPKNRVIERSSPIAFAEKLDGISECCRANPPKELYFGAFGRHTSQTLGFATDAPLVHSRIGLSHRARNRRYLWQWAGDLEVERTIDDNARETKEFIPARKRSLSQEEPNNLLLSARKLKELEQAQNRNAYEQMLSTQFFAGALGTVPGGDSSSKWEKEVAGSQDHQEVNGKCGKPGSPQHMGSDIFSKTVAGMRNPFRVHQEEQPGLSLDLTLSLHSIPKDIKLPIASHSFNPAVNGDSGRRAQPLSKQSEGPRRINPIWEFLNPVAADCCNRNHNGFDDTGHELRNSECLQHGSRVGGTWAFESSQRMVIDSDGNFQPGEGAGVCNGVDVNLQLGNGAAKPFTVLSAPFIKEDVPCTDETKIARIAALPEIDRLNTEGDRLACVDPTLPPLSCGFACEMKKNFNSTIKKVKLDPENSTPQGSSKGCDERETEISQVQGSCLHSEVSYEPNGMMKAEITTSHAGLGGSESLDTAEYRRPISVCPLPDNLEAQIDGTGRSEDSTCRSKPANGRMEMLPLRICSQSRKLSHGESEPECTAIAYGESHAEHVSNTHGALDLLVDAVQVALSPITETGAMTDETQERPRAGAFVNGGILIPQKRVSRQARSRERRRKVPTLGPEHDELQIVKVDSANSLSWDENGISDLPKTLQDTDRCNNKFKSSLALLSLEGKEFFDPFIESKRGRIRTLPLKFRDSVLEPWKKGTWKKNRPQP